MTALKGEILEFIQKRKSVTYVELSEHIEGFNGNVQSLVPNFPSIVYWSGMSDEAYEAIAELLNSGTIFHIASTSKAYLISGGGLKLPVVKNLKPTVKQHWLPVSLSISPE